MKRAAVMTAAALGLGLMTGCGGGGSSLTASNLVVGGRGNEQTVAYDNLITRGTGTVKPPVTTGSSGATVTGVAGAAFSSIVFNDPSPTSAETEIAFARTTEPGLYVVNPSTSVVTQFISLPSFGYSTQSWSPNGANFAYTSNNEQIMVANGSGQNSVALTNGVNPTWNGNGQILFQSSNKQAQIYAINTDGSRLKNLSNNSFNDTSPACSIAGVVAFVRLNAAGQSTSQIYRMSLDGSSQINLSGGNTHDQNPAWSPSGLNIAFSNGAIYTMDPFGSARTKLTPPPVGGIDVYPTWSPDGAQIAFTRANYSSGASAQIWVMNADGSNAHMLTNNAFDVEPVWSPFFTQRTFIGANGNLGSTAAGFVFAHQGAAIASLIAFNATTPSSAVITAQTPIGSSLPDIVMAVSADALTSLGFVNGNDAPISIITGSVPAANGALVDLDARSGRVSDILPYNAGRAASLGPPSVRIENGVHILQGAFIGVFDGQGRNHAPQGAHEVRLDGRTGAILAVR